MLVSKCFPSISGNRLNIGYILSYIWKKCFVNEKNDGQIYFGI